MLVLLFCNKTDHRAHLFEALFMLDLYKKILFTHKISFIKNNQAR